MIDPLFLESQFAQALSYERYVDTGKPEHRRAWASFRERAGLTPARGLVPLEDGAIEAGHRLGS